MDGSSFRSFQRISADFRQRQDEEQFEEERAALEQIHAKSLAAREAVLVRGPHGWKVVKLAKLAGDDRAALLAKVYRGADDEKLGFLPRIVERLDR